MAKDPAFLFYPSDFLTGTMFFSDAQVGRYLRLLCAQHQHGGMIDKGSFNSIVGDDAMIRAKFVEIEDGFFNERLMAEIQLRKKKSSNLSANASIRWEKYKQKQSNCNAIASGLHIPIEDEDENVIEDRSKDKNKKERKPKIELVYPFTSDRFNQLWSVLITQPKWKKKSPEALQMSLKKMSLVSGDQACEMMEATIAGGWAGLFENSNNGKHNNNKSGRLSPEDMAAQTAAILAKRFAGQ